MPRCDSDESDDELQPDPIKEDLLISLSQFCGLGAFAYGNTITAPANPGLFIEGHGNVGLPLSKNDANVIISKSKQSPYGKGARTIVDTAVRKSFELNPSQFALQNLKWEEETIKELLGKVYLELNLSCGLENVKAELYKLLLYQEGAFFKPHKDSEKAPGMFGTLVVCLSSEHQGGNLVLTHRGEKYEFKTSPHSKFAMSYGAWYSDVLHEVKPVTSGYRLVLTYNLIRPNETPVQLPPPSMAIHKRRLAEVLQQYNTSVEEHPNDCLPYLVHKFEHQYTQASLRAELLKGADLAQTRVVSQVASDHNFDLYLATMERTIKKDDLGYEGEIESTLELNHIIRLDGRQVKMHTNFPLDENNVLDPDFDEEDFDEENHTGYTGNEGSTGTYWYRDTVSCLPPQLHHSHSYA